MLEIGRDNRRLSTDPQNLLYHAEERNDFWLKTGKEKIEKGYFIFPEEVASNNSKIRLEDHLQLKTSKVGDQELFIWYFDTTFRQNFSYHKYPFDHKTVWIKMWPKAFAQNIILIPDLASYKRTDEKAIFGYEKDIVLGHWNMQNSYFDYECSSYDTTFGTIPYWEFLKNQGNEIHDYLHEKQKIQQNSCWLPMGNSLSVDESRLYPTLRYNIIIQRKFENVFITNFIPLFIVAMLLLGITMMITNDSQKADRFGLNTAGVIASCSALFFTIMLSHIQLKQQFEGVGVVYMEYFYFLMYFVILFVAVNSYLLTIGWSSRFSLVQYQDNLIFKVAFWPILLGLMVIITWLLIIN